MPVNMERRALLAFGLLWLGGVRAIAAPTAVDVAGLWSAEARSRGGLGWQMLCEGTELTLTFGALIDLTYEIDGNTIKMFIANANEPPTLIAQPFTIEGDMLTIAQGAAGPPLVMKRVGAPHQGAHPIVGDWSYKHQTGAQAIQRFGRGKRAQLSVQIDSHKSPYRVEGETLHMESKDGAPVVLTIKREGNVLTTRDASGKEFRYIRFEY
jgi:hypothetical protein